MPIPGSPVTKTKRGVPAHASSRSRPSTSSSRSRPTRGWASSGTVRSDSWRRAYLPTVRGGEFRAARVLPRCRRRRGRRCCAHAAVHAGARAHARRECGAVFASFKAFESPLRHGTAVGVVRLRDASDLVGRRGRHGRRSARAAAALRRRAHDGDPRRRHPDALTRRRRAQGARLRGFPRCPGGAAAARWLPSTPVRPPVHQEDPMASLTLPELDAPAPDPTPAVRGPGRHAPLRRGRDDRRTRCAASTSTCRPGG